MSELQSQPDQVPGANVGQPARTGPRRFWLVGLLGLATLGVVVWFLVGIGVDRKAAEAVDLSIRSRQYDQALTQAQSWVDRAPRSGEAQYQKARALLALNRPQEALEVADRARALGVPESRLARILGIIHARSGRNAEAEPILRQAQAMDSEPDCLVEETLAQLDMLALKFGPALKSIERWSKVSPTDPRPFFFRAEIDQQVGADLSILATGYRAALERDPNFSPARLALADVLRKQGEPELALEEFKRHLEKNPKAAAALAGAGQCALDLGQEVAARDWFDRAILEDADQVVALEGRVAIALRAGEASDALPLLDRLIKREPTQVELHYQRAVALERLGRSDEARAEREATDRLRRENTELDRLRKATIKKPRDVETRVELAHWLLDHDRGEEGVSLALQILRMPGGHPSTAEKLADYYARQGNTGLANYYRAQAGRGTAVKP